MTLRPAPLAQNPGSALRNTLLRNTARRQRLSGRHARTPRLVAGHAGQLDEHVHACKGEAHQEQNQQPQAQAARAPACKTAASGTSQG